MKIVILFCLIAIVACAPEGKRKGAKKIDECEHVCAIVHPRSDEPGACGPPDEEEEAAWDEFAECVHETIEEFGGESSAKPSEPPAVQRVRRQESSLECRRALYNQENENGESCASCSEKYFQDNKPELLQLGEACGFPLLAEEDK